MKKSVMLPFTVVLMLIACDQHDDVEPEGQLTFPDADIWWNDHVFYEILVRSYYDSDGDGIGDFQGIIQKLDYLNDGNAETDTDLGITGIWLMPVFKSPSYHGYDVTDYRNVNPQYGTMDDFKRLLDEAHQRGIKIIIDYVINHTSEHHPWFINSATSATAEKRQWYNWTNSKPDYLGPWGQQVWHLKNGSYYYGVFWSGMPDLNYYNNQVTSEMKDVARYWYDIGVDGFRVDAPGLLIESGQQLADTKQTLDWWRAFYAFQKNLDAGLMTVGEVWATTDKVLPYADKRFDYCFEFDLSYAIVDAAKNGNPAWLETKISEVVSRYSEGQYGVFLTNHDQNRIIEELEGNLSKAKVAAGILLTLPGVPYLYYGEEVGMRGMKPDEHIRRPMQWSAGANAGFTTGYPWMTINPDYTTFNVQTMQDDSGSLWNHYRKLIHVRNDSEALKQGTCTVLRADNPGIISYVRSTKTESVLVIQNLSPADIEGAALSLNNSELPAGTYGMTELLSGAQTNTIIVNGSGGFNGSTPIDVLERHTTYILKLEKQ